MYRRLRSLAAETAASWSRVERARPASKKKRMAEGLDLETSIRAACDAADPVTAATLIIEGYGGELMAFLLARLRSQSDAEEVFAAIAEKLWIGLPGFEWRCSLRSWLYRLARNAAIDFSTAAQNRPGRHVRLSHQASPSWLVDRVRSTTATYRQTAAKDRMRELRETLPLDDQMLLILRVDRAMDWRDLATAMSDEHLSLEGAELEREAARLRKRFERVKERLRELAREAGLL
jgi:RNA polymerase sigma-70 factor (ECF subfamily)